MSELSSKQHYKLLCKIVLGLTSFLILVDLFSTKALDFLSIKIYD